jgi:hypothetical protein
VLRSDRGTAVLPLQEVHSATPQGVRTATLHGVAVDSLEGVRSATPEEERKRRSQDLAQENTRLPLAQGSGRARKPTLRQIVDSDLLGGAALDRAKSLLGAKAPQGSLYSEAYRILSSDERIELVDAHRARRSA